MVARGPEMEGGTAGGNLRRDNGESADGNLFQGSPGWHGREAFLANVWAWGSTRHAWWLNAWPRDSMRCSARVQQGCWILQWCRRPGRRDQERQTVPHSGQRVGKGSSLAPLGRRLPIWLALAAFGGGVV